jgi:putative endonuclease
MFFVYVLKSLTSGKYYTGQTNDLNKRIEQHNTRIGRYTSNKGPWELIYHEEYDNRAEAMMREKFLKSGKGRELLKTLLTQGSPPKADWS